MWDYLWRVAGLHVHSTPVHVYELVSDRQPNFRRRLLTLVGVKVIVQYQRYSVPMSAVDHKDKPDVALEAAAPTSSHNDFHHDHFVSSFNYVLKKAGFFDAGQTDPYETYKRLVSSR